jgi:hypothetical protein
LRPKRGFEAGAPGSTLSRSLAISNAAELFDRRHHLGLVCLLEIVIERETNEAHFISKLTDCDGENSESDSSLDFAKDCGYITVEQHMELTSLCSEIGKMLGSMINNPGPFLTTDR